MQIRAHNVKRATNIIKSNDVEYDFFKRIKKKKLEKNVEKI